jgi:hypothetical protein
MFNAVALPTVFRPHGRSGGSDGDSIFQDPDELTAGGSEELFPVASEEVPCSKSSVCRLWIDLTSSKFMPKILNTPSHSFSFTDGFFIIIIADKARVKGNT